MKKILLFVFAICIFNVHIFSSDINFAKKLYNDGLIEESRKEFEKVINEYPASNAAAEATFYIAKGYIQLKNYSQAINYLNKILTSYKNYPKIDVVISEMAKAYFNMKEYSKAIMMFEKLFREYPMSEQIKKSLSVFADALYFSKKYEPAISKLNELIKNYPNNKKISYIYLTLAKVLYESKDFEKAKNIAKAIIKKYPESNERWEAEILILNHEKLTREQYIQKLKKIINKKLPRKYDEELSYQLALKYVEGKNDSEAKKIVQYLLKKYNNSDKLCLFLQLMMQININLNNAKQNISLYQSNERKIPNDTCRINLLYLLAKSYLKNSNYPKAENLINNLLSKKLNRENTFKILLLKSDLFKATKRFIPAIKNYLYCANEFPDFHKNNQLYFLVANIYQKDLRNYQKAIEYYKKIYQYSKYYTNSLLQIAICYEKLGDFEKSIESLTKIDISSIKNPKIKIKIKRKIKYLRNFKLKNYHVAFDHLLEILIKNSNKENPDYQDALISIYANDLKMYEKALKLLEKSDNYYMLGKILLKIYEKSKLEGIDNKEIEEKFSVVISKLKNNEEKYNELILKKEMINQIDVSLIKKLEQYIDKYQDSEASKEFKIKVAEFYLEKNQMEKAEKYILLLNDENDNEIQKLKKLLAEWYFTQKRYNDALMLYSKSIKQIDLSEPLIMFHYAVVLYFTGKVDQSIEKLEFLVNNTEFFENKEKIYIFLAKSLAEKKNYKSAISYLNDIPADYRDDNFYLLLSSYYYELEDFENSKLALMHIEKKSIEILEKLADLQINTNDKEMAKYTLSQLISKQKDNLKYIKKLGELYFETKDFKNAVKYLKQYITKAKEKDKNLIVHLIISYLKIKNRPKADFIKKQYKKLIDSNDKELLTLEYGIYYLDIDPSVSIKKFKSIIKSKNADMELKYKAHFWRGVAYLKQKKVDLAFKDFLIAKKSDDKNLLLNVYLKLGTIYFSKEDYENSLKNYMYVIENAKYDKIAYDAAKNFVMVCKTIEDWDKAINMYQLILERWGKDTKIKSNTLFDIGFCYFRAKKYIKSINYFEKALPLLNDKDTMAEAQYWIGECYYGLENYEKAITEFLKVYYNFPSQIRWAASAQLRAADSYIKLRKFDKAKDILKRIISIYGKSGKWGQQAQIYLEKL